MKSEKWGLVELSFTGKTEGNPFTDYEIEAEFSSEDENVKIYGFYDGDGVYKVRFMPSFEGMYSYKVYGSFSEETYAGTIEVAAAGDGNHGPVHPYLKRYLAYADETPYYSIGTTCYAWVNQSEELQKKTLETLENSCFNKIRFCFFPKYYTYNYHEPITYPYERGVKRGQDAERLKKAGEQKLPEGVLDITDFDFYTFNVEHFKRFDRQIEALMKLGIEADLILMHPYDKWGFANMTRECDELYIRYVTARYAAYRNVWWSLANEYDLTTKTEEDWERIAAIIGERDPYHHMISIHNCIPFYDYHKDWITHCSMQRQDLYKCVELTDKYLDEYEKPVVWDEICYEGNIDWGWGNITAEEMVRRFWEAFLRGGHAGHGETYVGYNDILWWAHGGELHGESAPRFQFLLDIMKQTPNQFLKHKESIFDIVAAVPYNEKVEPLVWGQPPCMNSYEIQYFGFMRPTFRCFDLPEDETYRIEVIDTWNMTIEDKGVYSGHCRIELPGTQYMAVRITREDITK